eukprot:CAMPEP_0113321454 /NCGR_PEP_ID=MMETSP0010_2-20120614/14936_1 /TAXON_ID=216773 ORGANISM="Corethron hystrix, Strain 308" /NCGR_SAMPLE_ID=MMETSP0010_2 /ASSEMBLY_ACC=CAM_ASM_000155 /LENGTH=89 /DNA_ID=CAMNT_0000179599 /DNA_START=141 /DNA_END=406 /DNA_ORIENTATION=+ /assembly_acc=CAM_ASM_000155
MVELRQCGNLLLGPKSVGDPCDMPKEGSVNRNQLNFHDERLIEPLGHPSLLCIVNGKGLLVLIETCLFSNHSCGGHDDIIGLQISTGPA